MNELSPYTYYIATLFLYSLQMFGAIMVADVSIIFEFIAAFALSAI